MDDEETIQTHEDSKHFPSISADIGFEETSQMIEENTLGVSPRSVNPEELSQSVLGSIDDSNFSLYESAASCLALSESRSIERVPSVEDAPHCLESQPRPSQSLTDHDSHNYLTAWAQFNPLMQPCYYPTSMFISDLIPYMESAASLRVDRLIWHRHRNRALHDFLLLQVESPQNRKLWMRLVRPPYRNSIFRGFFSIAASDEPYVTWCDKLESLYYTSQSKVLVVTIFTDPPPLEKLGRLLSIVEKSAMYTRSPGFSRFFCSVIYENLFSMGKGLNIDGVPDEVSMSLIPKLRAIINNRMNVMRPPSSWDASSNGLNPRVPSPSPTVTEIPSTDPYLSIGEEIGTQSASFDTGFRKTNQSIDENPRAISSRSFYLESPLLSVLDDSEIPYESAESHMVPYSASETIPEDAPHRFHSSKPRTDSDNFSMVSDQPNLFTQSWRRPAMIPISALISYIESTPSIPLNRLIWCRDRKGVQHDFLLLPVERPQKKYIWIRLDRRPHQDSKVLDLVSATSSSADSAILCDDVKLLFDASRSEIIVKSIFKEPPPLKNLGSLLSILRKESVRYKLYSENCHFFCSVIYEILFTMGRGRNIDGVPNKFAMSLAPKVRAIIKNQVNVLLATGIPSIRIASPLSTEIPFTPSPLPIHEEIDHIQSVEETPSDPSSWSTRLDSADSPEMVPLDDDVPRHLRPHQFSSPLRTNPDNLSMISQRSEQSHLLTHRWTYPALLSVSDLILYIKNTPTSRINLLKWCKHRTGVRHEFLLLQLESPQGKNVWLRLERRPDLATVRRASSSVFPAQDSVMLCGNFERLYNVSQNAVIVETKFMDSPLLKNLGHLLSIITEESVQYKLLSENCWFFSSVIYENLFAMGGGVNINGAPNAFDMSLAPNVRAVVKARINSLLFT